MREVMDMGTATAQDAGLGPFRTFPADCSCSSMRHCSAGGGGG